MMRPRRLFLLLAMLLIAGPAAAQFVGDTPEGEDMTVAEAREARVDTYVTVTGNIIAHLRGDYYTFEDDSGTVRVEISSDLWQGREVTPRTWVRLLGEVDRSPSGPYLWIVSLDVVE